LVHVDPATGEERHGEQVPERLAAWLTQWWPLEDQPGRRAEVGVPRDAAWHAVVSRSTGVAVAVDYGHTRDDRPRFGSLRSYRDGREVDVRPDGTRDVTAHVAVDSVAAAVGGRLSRQRDALQDLGVSGARPDLAQAADDPAGYLDGLGRATQAAELTAAGGLGDLWWLVSA
jgi:SAM-dependent MidA family methyltransferase